ncbi:hypothetical protein [Amycolatopsis sp. NPDC004169]|uniref:twin-arginine translocation signal domain-containing protein n=1 Tax=Amycolatopsis sp. NPDC004169 TaxID=3154453 RepID=UPI00339E366F
MNDFSRRTLLRAGGVAAAAGMLPGVAFAGQPGGTSRTQTVTGTLAPDVPDWYYLPVDVPRGVRQIDVVYSYDKPAVPSGTRGNACDIGIFGPEGHEAGNARGFAAGPAASATASRSARPKPLPATSPARSARGGGTSSSARTPWRRRG